MDEVDKVIDILDEFVSRYPVLSVSRDVVEKAYNALIKCYENGGKLLVCGNGGSAADSSHIVGELMKGFLKKRELSFDFKEKLMALDAERGTLMSTKLQGALPALSLSSHYSLTSAVSNDLGGDLIYAQQVLGYGRRGDVLLGISTSGNAENVVNAMIAAKASGLKVIGLTGASSGMIKAFCDIIITVPADKVHFVQELHLPVYHALCAMVEEFFYG